MACSIDFEEIGNWIDSNAPSPACDDAYNSFEALFVGDVCTDEIVANRDQFASFFNVCLNDDNWDWEAVEDSIVNLFDPTF